MAGYRRNFLVGVTMIGALVVLAWMIIKFSGRTALYFAEAQFPVSFVTERADGVVEGSPVLYRGVGVGRVTRVRLDAAEGVLIDAQIDAKPELPANVEGRIRSQSLVGPQAALSLELVDRAPAGRLSAGQQLRARYMGSEFLPPEFVTLATELRETVTQFRKSNVVTDLDQAVQKAAKMLDSIQTLVDDPKMREDIRASIANLRSASESATRIGTNLEKFSGNLDTMSQDASATLTQARAALTKTEDHINSLAEQIAGRLEQTSKLLDHFQSISAKIDAGEGTAGLFVNDPRLYESLVDTSRELNTTVADMKRLVEQWEQEGVTMKLK